MPVSYCGSDEEEESESYVLTMREVDVHHRTPASIPKMSQIKRTPIPLTNSWKEGGGCVKQEGEVPKTEAPEGAFSSKGWLA